MKTRLQVLIGSAATLAVAGGIVLYGARDRINVLHREVYSPPIASCPAITVTTDVYLSGRLHTRLLRDNEQVPFFEYTDRIRGEPAFVLRDSAGKEYTTGKAVAARVNAESQGQLRELTGSASRAVRAGAVDGAAVVAQELHDKGIRATFRKRRELAALGATAIGEQLASGADRIDSLGYSPALNCGMGVAAFAKIYVAPR